MSMLIDYINNDDQACIDGKWYIAKPVPYFIFMSRIKDAIRILRGKSIAVHYKEDEGK